MTLLVGETDPTRQDGRSVGHIVGHRVGKYSIPTILKSYVAVEAILVGIGSNDGRISSDSTLLKSCLDIADIASGRYLSLRSRFAAIGPNFVGPRK